MDIIEHYDELISKLIYDAGYNEQSAEDLARHYIENKYRVNITKIFENNA